MSMRTGFAIWVTGIPASGKSTITRELVTRMEAGKIHTVVLESDLMRTILTPEPNYNSEERDRFYHQMAQIGALITRSGVNVIFDATAHKRAYRDYARSLIPKFVEVYVRCPLDICMKRDPKGIYGRASAGGTSTVPGMQTPYETPRNPEVTLDGQASPATETDLVIDNLMRLLYI